MSELTEYPGSDGYWYGESGISYADVHDSASETVYSLFDYLSVGQQDVGGHWYIFRAGLIFNTSAIPDTATLLSASLLLNWKTDVSDVDFDIAVVEGANLVPFDFDDLGSVIGGSVNSSQFAQDTYVEIGLNAIALGWIVKGGTTRLGLRSVNDINSIPPGQGSNLQEYVNFHSLEVGGDFRPKLIVTYETEGPLHASGLPVLAMTELLLG